MTTTSTKRPVTDQERERLLPAKEFVETNALQSPTLAQAAAVVGASQFHFHRRFKAAFGVTAKQIVNQRQIAEAKELMLEGVPLGDIATRCGFAHQSHFCSRFKQLVGQTPRGWLASETATPAEEKAQ